MLQIHGQKSSSSPASLELVTSTIQKEKGQVPKSQNANFEVKDHDCGDKQHQFLHEFHASSITSSTSSTSLSLSMDSLQETLETPSSSDSKYCEEEKALSSEKKDEINISIPNKNIYNCAPANTPAELNNISKNQIEEIVEALYVKGNSDNDAISVRILF